jgi:hypothetical protein
MSEAMHWWEDTIAVGRLSIIPVSRLKAGRDKRRMA